MNQFKIEFYGVRGSTAASMRDKMEFGCNTACLLVTVGEHHIILDMGTGFVNLGERFISQGTTKAAILLSHFHYDHLEGLPFFRPFFKQGEYHIYGEGRGDIGLRDLIEGHMRRPYFPVTPDVFRAEVIYHDLRENAFFHPIAGVRARTIRAPHPDSSTAYRIEYEDKALVYLVDYEHEPSRLAEITEFCKGADLLIYDAPFTDAEYEEKRFQGWGHSTYEEGARLALNANVKNLVFTHHNSTSTDQKLFELEQYAAAHFSKACLARERMVIDL